MVELIDLFIFVYKLFTSGDWWGQNTLKKKGTGEINDNKKNSKKTQSGDRSRMKLR